MKIEFIKMHGCGNDFMIIDNRSGQCLLNEKLIKNLGSRKTGIGFDQLILLDLSEKATIEMKIFNADGSRAGMCGNAVRCVAGIIMDDIEEDEVLIELASGIIKAKAAPNDEIAVDLGIALFNPAIIPIKPDLDPLAVAFNIPGLPKAVALSVGNPHLVFFLDKNHHFDINFLGPMLENHDFFPDRINISFAIIDNHQTILLNVWERGAGRTLACGSAACATAAAAVKMGLCRANQDISVSMDGGVLKINVSDDYQLRMTGPYKMVYKGIIDLEDA